MHNNYKKSILGDENRRVLIHSDASAASESQLRKIVTSSGSCLLIQYQRCSGSNFKNETCPILLTDGLSTATRSAGLTDVRSQNASGACSTGRWSGLQTLSKTLAWEKANPRGQAYLKIWTRQRPLKNSSDSASVRCRCTRCRPPSSVLSGIPLSIISETKVADDALTQMRLPRRIVGSVVGAQIALVVIDYFRRARSALTKLGLR